MGAVSQLSRKNPPRSSIGGDVLLYVGKDSMPLEDFTRVVFHCGDLKTWDGVCPISQVLVDGVDEVERAWSFHLHKSFS